MHRDFAPPQPAGCHWAMADELREEAPVFFNTFARGYGVSPRHDAVRDIYKTPELFSSESITPWQPDPIYRFVPTQIDAPDHIKYRRIVNPWFLIDRKSTRLNSSHMSISYAVFCLKKKKKKKNG